MQDALVAGVRYPETFGIISEDDFHRAEEGQGEEECESSPRREPDRPSL